MDKSERSVALPDCYYIYGGKTFEIEFYVTQDGSVPGYEYHKRMNDQEQRRFLAVIQIIADAPIGTIFPKMIYNIEDKEHSVYAIKPSQ